MSTLLKTCQQNLEIIKINYKQNGYKISAIGPWFKA